MPSSFRDPAAPAPNQPRRIGVVALIERDGALLRFVPVDEIVALELSPAQRPVIEAFLAGRQPPVVA